MTAKVDGAGRLREILDAFIEVKCLVGRNIEAAASATGLGRTRFLIAMDVIEHPATTLSELCARTGLKKSAASRLVDLMVGEALLTRGRPGDDRRSLSLDAGPALDRDAFCSESALKAIFPGWGLVAGKDRQLASIVGALRSLAAMSRGEGGEAGGKSDRRTAR